MLGLLARPSLRHGAPPSVLRTAVRLSASLWRHEHLCLSPEGRYRVHRRVNKPTAPLRLEAVRGVKGRAFLHGVLLPDGHVLPWYGRPGNDFVQFWRHKVAEWRALLAARAARGLPEVFCCPRCDGILTRLPRPKGFDELFAEDRYRCDTPTCRIDEARVRKTKTVAVVEVLRGVREDKAWRRLVRGEQEDEHAAGEAQPQRPPLPRGRASKVVDLPPLEAPEAVAAAEALRRLREARAAAAAESGGGEGEGTREGGAEPSREARHEYGRF